MKTIHPNDVPRTPRTRDAALRRLSRTNRWLIAGSAVLTGVLTDVAANAFPGHAARKATSSATKRKHAKHKPLKAPAQPPKPATTSTEHATPQPAETTPAETQPPAESAPAPQATPEPAPAEETPAPAAPEPAPQAEEPSEPVVSGGS
ncbi:MAG: hypothetical protein QOK19_2777 [Solirubrobacteraceae bacterium]|jgi:hypothetical protein|nr:hypothetical protein [Solirubrobacterales bacterium]MEA2217216.1 hypothetical protein [Solirubrobacteraceae bacterium]